MRKRIIMIQLAMLMMMFIITGCTNRYTPHDIEIPVTKSQSADLPELYISGEPAKITYEQVKGITSDMTFGQVVERLGATLDIGSGNYVLVYGLEDDKQFILTVTRWDEPVGKSGKELLEANVKE